MIDHTQIQLALQARLLTLLVCTTGAQTLSATATGYHRTAGSFVTDGFAAGMEVTPSGFGVNAIGQITAVTATDLTIDGGCAVDGPVAGRTLAVQLPTLRAWENVPLKRVPGRPFLEEQYVPGPSTIQTLGPNGLLLAEPMYSPRIYVPAGVGIAADSRYADAILTLFASKTAIALPNGDTLLVRGDVGPFRGQRHPDADENWSVIPVTIPLRLYTPNSL